MEPIGLLILEVGTDRFIDPWRWGR